VGEGGLLEALSESESRQVLEQVIIPPATTGAVRQSRPLSPGSRAQGRPLSPAALDRRGGAVLICRDLYKAAHRRYTELLTADVRTVGVQVRPDARAR
jgi:hypothetical protein